MTSTGARVEVDGVDDAHTVLVEAGAHQGPPKSAQRHKVLADAFKLAWIASTLQVRLRLILCFSMRPPRSLSSPVDLGPQQPCVIRASRCSSPGCPHVRAGIVEAQRRQYR